MDFLFESVCNVMLTYSEFHIVSLGTKRHQRRPWNTRQAWNAGRSKVLFPSDRPHGPYRSAPIVWIPLLCSHGSVPVAEIPLQCSHHRFPSAVFPSQGSDHCVPSTVFPPQCSHRSNPSAGILGNVRVFKIIQSLKCDQT